MIRNARSGLCLGLAVALVYTARSQDLAVDTPPRIELSTDKPVYGLNEPVVLTVTAVNVSDEPQWFNNFAVRGTLLQFRITDPDGKPVNLYGLEAETIYATSRLPRRPREDNIVQPGGARTADLLISHFYPVTAKVGTFDIEVRLQPENSDAVGADVVRIRVSSPGDAEMEREIIEPFGRAVECVRSTNVIDRRTIEAIEAIVSSSNPGVAYLSEAASFYLALLDERLSRQMSQTSLPHDQRIDFQARRPIDRAIAGYEVFQQRYPDSVFGYEVLQGLRRMNSFARRMREDPRH